MKTEIENLLVNKRGYVYQTPYNEDVILLMSGGIDSSIAAEMCVNRWKSSIYPLYIGRGATAEKQEINATKNVLTYLKTKYPDQINEPFTIDAKIPPLEIKDQLSKERIFKSGHPLRNSIMQSYAVQYGVGLNDNGKNTRTILVGSVASDFFAGSTYTDMLINTLYTCSNLGEWEWQILSPFLQNSLTDFRVMKKIDLIRWGMHCNFPFSITRTCTRGDDLACGECNECVERISTFKEAGSYDPIAYREYQA